jgi:hypothetical protein
MHRERALYAFSLGTPTPTSPSYNEQSRVREIAVVVLGLFPTDLGQWPII